MEAREVVILVCYERLERMATALREKKKKSGVFIGS